MSTYKDKYIKYKKKYLDLKNKSFGGRILGSKSNKFILTTEIATNVSKNITIWFLKKAKMNTKQITWNNFKKAVIKTFKIFKVDNNIKNNIRAILKKNAKNPLIETWWSIAIIILQYYENYYISTQEINELLEIK